MIATFMRIALIVILITCCRSTASDSGGLAWTSRDSWYNPPPTKTLMQLLKHPLPDDESLVVDAGLQGKAQARLSSRPAIEVKLDELRSLTGKSVDDIRPGAWFLLRGVSLKGKSGSFRVYQHEEKVLVYYGSMGSKAAPMQRTAIAARLNRTPDAVYLIVKMTE